MCMGACKVQKRMSDPLGAGVIGGYEMPDMGAGSKLWPSQRAVITMHMLKVLQSSDARYLIYHNNVQTIFF